MVFAVAALLLQFSSAPKVMGPTFTSSLTANTFTTTDGTRPKPATAMASSATDTIEATSGKGYIATDAVSLGRDTGDKPATSMTAVALTDHTGTEPLAVVRIPEPAAMKPIKVYAAERPRMSRSWLALAIMQHGAATFDAYSTRQAIGHGAVEDDPLMRPFAHSGAMYAAIQVGPLVLDYVARRMQHSEYGMVRRMWFVPQSASTAGFLISGLHNLSVASR
jgi:hypothetical protein